MTKIKIVGGAIILRKNKELGVNEVLLIRRPSDDMWPFVWEFPRGGCRKDEDVTLEKCIKREVKEEVGLDVEVVKFVNKFEYRSDDKRTVQYNFLCKMKDEKQPVVLNPEHDQYKWVSSLGQVELMTPPEIKRTISLVLNIKKKIVSYPDIVRAIDEMVDSFMETKRWLKWW